MQPRHKQFRLQLYARATAPCRDYYGLTINNETIVFNIWNISHGPHVYPKMTRSYLYDYPDNKRLQNDIERLFGSYVNEYILQLANDKVALQCLPTRAFLCILDFLAKKDIVHLSQTSKIFFQLCQTDSVWKLIYEKILRRKPSYYEEQDAIDRGWKDVLRRKLHRLRNICTIPTHSKDTQGLSTIKYNSLKLDNDEKEKTHIIEKAGGDGRKPTSASKKLTIDVKTPAKPLKSALKNPIPKITLSKPDITKIATNITKPMAEQYTTTLARKTFMIPKVKLVKSAKK